MQKENETKSKLDELSHSFYNLFTNRNGREANVKGVYDLFIPQGFIIKNCESAPIIYTIDQFVEPRLKLFGEGILVDFMEFEMFEKTEIFGKIAHRFSLYNKAGVLAGKKFDTDGINSIQFVETPEGWKISSMIWDDEREGLVVPERYRPKK